jgi:PAS domain S-box-containing protein
MIKSLLRQLRKSLGVADETELDALLNALKSGADSAQLAGFVDGFRDLLMRVDSSYEQYERDIALRARSLEISSGELSLANDKLRDELTSRDDVLRALRSALRGLLPDSTADESIPMLVEQDIGVLAQRIAELVTERERGRRALSNQKFALDQHAIVSITDVAGRIVYANDRFCQISGYEREALIGQNHRIVNSGVHPREFFADLWGTIQLGQVWHGEICNRTRTGEVYWVNATIVPLLGENGEPEQFIGIRTDITDRKRMEAQLLDQLHLVEELLEAIPLPVYLKDEHGRYLRLNRAFELFFHVSREEFIGKTVHDLLKPEDAILHAEKDAELFINQGIQTYEATVRSRDGMEHDTIYRKAALNRRDGTVYGLLGAIIDITDRKAAERDLLLAKDAAEAASRAKSDFLANMSHEIRTPMNGIIGMTDLALDTALTEEQREFMSIVKSSAEALLTIINDILDFSKIEAGKLMVEHISFDLHRTLAETLKTLALRAHEKGIELISDLAPDLPRHVMGDPSRIRQVVINLVGNAIKFTHAGEIALSAVLQARAGNTVEVQIAVRDTGIGIAPEKQALIFEAFSQEDTSTTRRYGGTGLGLSISRRLVELMGGELWLESQLGKGSTFAFSVRLALDDAPPEGIHGHVDLRGKRILVVDDNATNRRVLCGMLATWDIIAHQADSGAAALALLANRQAHFDCILLDAHMPEMDGFELAARLQGEMNDVPPMLMLSSGAMRGDGQRCHEVGISGFFSKPISAEELLAAICRVFGVSAPGQPAAPHQLVTRHALRELQRTLNVLLVEDHPVNQKLALGLLEKWGHRSVLANNGREAVDLFGSEPFDVILMDMQMPVMGGIEATRLIRAREQAAGLAPTPIIAMTANAMQSDREACLQAGMDDYLAKPIKARDLMEKLMTIGAMPGEPGETPVYDYGEGLAEADREMVEIIAEVFLETWPRDMLRLRQALREGDVPAFERAAHSLKGAMATFVAAPAVRLASELEAAASEQALTELAGQVDRLEAEIQLLVPHLQAVVRQLSG